MHRPDQGGWREEDRVFAPTLLPIPEERVESSANVDAPYPLQWTPKKSEISWLAQCAPESETSISSLLRKWAG